MASAGIRIEKLNDSNFHSWKQKIELVLGHREVDDMIDPVLRPSRPGQADELVKWMRKDKTARLTIGLTLCDEMLKNVSHTSTALEMWQEICNVHQRHTLLNKLAARRDFYTATMKDGESMLVYINRVRQMASVLESMNVSIDDKEMAMAVLNGLPARFETIITALDAIGDEDESFTFSKVRSRLLQEEKRVAMRDTSSNASRASALVNNINGQPRGVNTKLCSHCGRKNHTEPYCWQKYGRPTNSRGGRSRGPLRPTRSSAAAIVATDIGEPETSEGVDTHFLCLMANTKSFSNKESVPKKASVWYIDSAATSHMTFDRTVFATYTKISPFNVEMGDKSTSVAIGRGDVHVSAVFNGVRTVCKLRDVLHVPSFVYSLISVSTLTRRGLTVRFTENSVAIARHGFTVIQGTRHGGLYTLDVMAIHDAAETACVANMQLWHERMAHVHTSGISHMAKQGIVNGLTISPGGQKSTVCEGCVAGKMARAPIPKSSSTRATGLLDLVHTDIAGPMAVSSKGGARYFVTFIDDNSRWLTVYPLRLKSDCFAAFLKFRASVETHTGRKIRALRSDGGGEYLSSEFKQFLHDKGIHHQQTCAYTPQQNGVAERMNRTLKDLVRAMLHHKRVSHEFWAEALSTATYIRNRVTSRGLPPNTTPFLLWFGRKPNVSHLRVFGSKCWYKVPDAKLRNLDSRACDAVMIGYASNHKAYKLWDVNKNEVVVSRDVLFDEKSTNQDSVHESIAESESVLPDDDPSQYFEPDGDNSPSRDDAEDNHLTPQAHSRPAVTLEQHSEKLHDMQEGGSTQHIESSHHNGSNSNVPLSKQLAPHLVTRNSSNLPRKSTRQRRAPVEWWKPTALASVTPDHMLTFTAATKGEEKTLVAPCYPVRGRLAALQ